jgi:hypothetical protein
VSDHADHQERWYVVYTDLDLVAYGPDTKDGCNRLLKEMEENGDVPESVDDAILIDRNGLVGFEASRGSRFEYGSEATDPRDVDGGEMGTLVDAVAEAWGGGDE